MYVFVVLCVILLGLISGMVKAGKNMSGTDIWALILAVSALVGLRFVYVAHARHRTVQDTALETARKREELSLQLVEALAGAIEARDQKGRGRAQRVRTMAGLIAEEMGVTGKELDAIRIASLLADIGKLAVPDHVLYKPGPLTEEEYRKVKTHAVVGASLLSGVPFEMPVIPMVRGHHECFDGTGYPDGLEGSETPLGARILAVADVYCALLYDRPDRPAFSPEAAEAVIKQGAGSKFDPRVVEACLLVLARERARDRIGFVFDSDEITSIFPRIGAENQSTAFADIAQAQRELIALFEIVQTTASSLSIHETLDLLTSKLQHIMTFKAGAVFLRDAASGNLTVVATCGHLAAGLRNKWLLWGEGVSGRVAATGHPSEINASAREDLTCMMQTLGRTQHDLVYALSVPLFDVQNQPCGAITLYDVTDGGFTDDDLRLLTTVAGQASLAVSKARAFEQTEKTALTDPLTGLPNARHFFMSLEQEVARARQDNKPLSLLLADIDLFKQINDTYGHQQGDHILRDVAKILCSTVRDSDLVARYGGDEFFLLLPATANRQATDTSLRIKDAVAAFKSDVGGIQLKLSVGVATFPGDASDAKTLLAVADKAMYAEKEINRKQYDLAREIAQTRRRPVPVGAAAHRESTKGLRNTAAAQPPRRDE